MAKGDELDLVLSNLSSDRDWLLLAGTVGLQEIEMHDKEDLEKATILNRAIRRIYGSGPIALVRKIGWDDVYYPDYIHIVRNAAILHGLSIQNDDLVLTIEKKLLDRIKAPKNRLNSEYPARDIENNDGRLLDIVIRIALLRREMIRSFVSYILGE